jgi:hypothetical protein
MLLKARKAVSTIWGGLLIGDMAGIIVGSTPTA